MLRTWLQRLHKIPLGICAALLINTGAAQAGDNDAELKKLIEEQNKQIQELKQRLDAVSSPINKASAADPAAPTIDESAVKKIVSDYLKENPGAGMPPSVQTGYTPGGFVIRSSNDPKYVQWDDDCKIPFELRFRGRLQLDYYNYKVTSDINHVSNTRSNQNANSVRQADFSQLEVKRLRLIWEGTVFDPNLRYHFEIDGNTRGLGAVQNNKVIQTTGGTVDPNASGASPVGGGATVDHAVRLFSAYVAYDFHGCASEKGCGLDCPEGSYKYTPTYTIIAGKMKPYFAFEEYLGSGNEQFVEFGMTEWFFDADDDNLLMAAGVQVKALEDRLFASALITNGNESQFPNTQMDNLPGFNVGFWYDFGGSWNEQKKKWDLYGDCVSDVDYSCHPVVRVGGMANLVPMNRRSLYGDDEQSRVFVLPGAPQGGTRLINMLSGSTIPTAAGGTPNGSHDVDEFDSYTYETFISGKYKGFSFLNDWFFRDLNNFRTTPNGRGNIFYVDSSGHNALFPANRGLFDYGTMLQGGYFIVPKKLEIAARFSWISGQSGDLNGHGTWTNVAGIPGVIDPVTGKPTTIRVINGAFTDFHEAREYAIGVNYYWKRQLLKWQTDFSIYQGGNPAGGGQSPAGFIAGSDGWLFRTQIQLAF
jgi:hypothetical protein